MSSFAPTPGDGSSTPRVLAVGGAFAITAIALAGSLGFGPGAQPSHSSARPATQSSSADGSAPSQTRTDNPTSSTPRSNRWLTVDKGPASGSGTSGSAPGTDSTAGSGGSTPATGSTASAEPLPADSGSGRRVVYDISAQRVWLVDGDGTVQRTYLVSGARQESLLDPGTYQVYSRSLDAISFNHTETMKYMVRFTQGRHSAIGFHDIPVKDSDGTMVQTRSQLGTPLSAGCIRQWEPDAKAMWRFAPDGTAIVVVA